LARAHHEGDTAPVRSLALLAALVPSLAFADEVDLSRGETRDVREPPTWVLRAEGGNEFAPFGYIGGCISWLIDPNDALELGAGGGFPGVQLGLVGKHLFNFGEGGQYILAELFLAGNTKVDRGLDPNAPPSNVQGTSSFWTGLGFGFEQRAGFFDLSFAGDLVFTSTSLTPHWSVHGGIGFGF
jgi:hypothetical protein